jgi:hypothetical protein
MHVHIFQRGGVASIDKKASGGSASRKNGTLLRLESIDIDTIKCSWSQTVKTPKSVDISARLQLPV